MRAILDPNVLISALLSRSGPPAKVLRAWLKGRFELIVCPMVIEGLERALDYPEIAERIKAAESAELLDWLQREAFVVEDPEEPPNSRSEDPGDDYLLALAETERAALASGDRHLLALTPELPVLTPREFLMTVGGT